MAYNFYQQQKQVSQQLEQQVSGFSEAVSQEGRQEISQRQSQLAQLSQETDIESAEEESQLKQIKIAGGASIVEGAALAFPALGEIKGLVKKGISSYQNIKSNIEEAKEAITNIKQSSNNITSSLNRSNITEPASREVEYENPLFEKSQATLPKEQFGDDIDMTGRQLSTEPTAVLPTEPALETPTKNPISENKSIMGDVPEGLETSALEDIGEGTEKAVVKHSKGLLGTIFGDIGETIGGILDPVGDIITAGLGAYSIVKGIQDEEEKAPAPTQTLPAPLPVEQIPTEIQSTPQVGI
jgi:hypothetical protein